MNLSDEQLERLFSLGDETIAGNYVVIFLPDETPLDASTIEYVTELMGDRLLGPPLQAKQGPEPVWDGFPKPPRVLGRPAPPRVKPVGRKCEYGWR